MNTAKGGHYVNKGLLKFKQFDSEDEEDDSDEKSDESVGSEEVSDDDEEDEEEDDDCIIIDTVTGNADTAIVPPPPSSSTEATICAEKSSWGRRLLFVAFKVFKLRFFRKISCAGQKRRVIIFITSIRANDFETVDHVDFHQHRVGGRLWRFSFYSIIVIPLR